VKAPEVKALVDVLSERLNNAVNTLGRLEEQSNMTTLAIPSLQEAVKRLQTWTEEEDRDHEAYLNLKRDVEDLKKWKSDQKQEKDELTRRKWSFGPNLLAALIAFLGNLILLAINIWLMSSKK